MRCHKKLAGFDLFCAHFEEVCVFRKQLITVVDNEFLIIPLIDQLHRNQLRYLHAAVVKLAGSVRADIEVTRTEKSNLFDQL